MLACLPGLAGLGAIAKEIADDMSPVTHEWAIKYVKSALKMDLTIRDFYGSFVFSFTDPVTMHVVYISLIGKSITQTDKKTFKAITKGWGELIEARRKYWTDNHSKGYSSSWKEFLRGERQRMSNIINYLS